VRFIIWQMLISDKNQTIQGPALPRIRGTIVRRRLLDRLHSHLEYHFQALIAPAGYGKTTLLADFVRELDAPVCWYTLNDVDRDPHSLFEGLKQSIQAGFPELPLPDISGSDKTPAALSAALAQVISRIPDYFVLVIEDLHVVNRSPSVELVDTIAHNWAETGHLLLSARALEGFDRICDWLDRQQAVRLTGADLSFSLDEVKLIALERCSVALSDTDAGQLVAKTGGWPLGVSLLLKSERNPLTMSVPASEQLFGFLSRQVLNRQTGDMKKLMLDVSVFSLIEPDIAARVLGTEGIWQGLGRLVEANMFITEINPGIFQFHQLFREFLQSQLKASQPERFDGLHDKAAAIYESQARYDLAIEHYITGGKPESAAGLIKRIGEKIIRLGRWASLAGWIERLPEPLQTGDVEIQMLHAQCLVHTGQPSRAGQMITRLLIDNEPVLDKPAKARALYIRSSACRLLGQHSLSLADAQTGAALLNDDTARKDLLGDIYARIGHLFFDKGEFARALTHLKKAKELFDRLFDLDKSSFASNTLGGVYKNLGDLEQASVYYEYARQGFTKTGNHANLSMVLSNVAYVQHKHGMQEAVLQTLGQARQNARSSGYLRIDSIIGLAYGEVYRDLGQYERSLQEYNEALDLARNSQENNIVAYAKAGLGETYRAMDEPVKAAYWTREALAQAKSEQQPYETALFKLQLGMVLQAQGNDAEAASLLKEAYKQLLVIGDQDGLARTCFAIAAAAFSQKDYETAGHWLEGMLGYIESLAYDDFVVIEGMRHPLLVQYAASKDIGGRYFNQLIERIKQKREQSSPHQLFAVDPVHLTGLEGYAFNQTRVILDKHEICDNAWRSNRAKELFFFLLGNTGRTAEEIAAELWPDLPPAKSVSNFHINLFRARRATSPGLIVQENGRYTISSEIDLWYDAKAFEDQYSRIARLPIDKRIQASEQIIDLYKGPFMPGFNSEWVSRKRAELENRYLKMLFEMVGYYAKNGRVDRVVTLVDKVLDTQPDEDEVYFQGIQAYLAMGEPLSAYHLYKRYISNIKELNAEPEPRIEKLVENLSFN